MTLDRVRFPDNWTARAAVGPALGLKPPMSTRRRVDHHGFIRWRRRRILISAALAHEDVCLDPDNDERYERWVMRWGSIVLGVIDVPGCTQPTCSTTRDHGRCAAPGS